MFVFFKGSSINEVKILGEGQGFCDNSTAALVKKSDDRSLDKNCPKLRDVINGRPLMIIRFVIATFDTNVCVTFRDHLF